LRRRPDRRGRLQGGAGPRPGHPRRPVGDRLRRRAARDRAGGWADHRPASRRAAGRAGHGPAARPAARPLAGAARPGGPAGRAGLSARGFAAVLLATALAPELPTVRLPAEELGAQGMALLLDLLSGGSPEPRVLPGELVVRASTAPPARRHRPT